MWSFVPIFCLAFAFGIGLAQITGAPSPGLAPLAWLACAGCGTVARRIPLSAAGFVASAFAAGAWVGAAPAPQPPPLPETSQELLATVQESRPGGDGYGVRLRIEHRRTLGSSEWVRDSRVVVLLLDDPIWLPTRGDIIYVTGRARAPGTALHQYAFDPRRHADINGVSGTFRPDTRVALVQPGRGPLNRLDRYRLRLERAIVSRVEQPAAGLLIAITTGSRGTLDPELRSRFADNGAAHVLAVSGLHLGLLCAAAFLGFTSIMRRVPAITRRLAARRAAAVAVVPVVLAYVVITGAPASAVRAGIMAVLVLVGVAFGRRTTGLHALALASASMLAFRPAWIANVGFQLSVSATLALIVSGRFRAAGRTWWARLVESLRMSTVASLATTPILLWHFGRAPYLSAFTNLIVVPPIALGSLPAALLGASCDALGVSGGAPLLWLAAAAAQVSFFAATHLARVLEVGVVWGRPGVLAMIGFVMLALAAPWLGRASLRTHLSVVVISAALLVAGRPPAWRGGTMDMHAIPVGQGDSTLVQMPDRTRILVDGGGNPFSRRSTGLTAVLPYLFGIGVGRVDIVVMTHSDFDHSGGLPDLVRVLRPREVWLPAGASGSAVDRLEREAALVGANIRRLSLPLVRLAGERARVSALPAPPGMTGNNASLVLRTCQREVCYLLTGDIEGPREEALMASGVALSAALMKVPHHGSLTSSSPAFIDRVRPRVAVFHVGTGNRFGFPRPDVVARYAARGIRCEFTQDGAFVARTDGTTLSLSPPLSAPAE